MPITKKNSWKKVFPSIKKELSPRKYSKRKVKKIETDESIPQKKQQQKTHTPEKKVKKKKPQKEETNTK